MLMTLRNGRNAGVAAMSPSQGSTGSATTPLFLNSLGVDGEAGLERAAGRAGRVPPFSAMTAALVPPPRAMSSRPGIARLAHSAPATAT